MKVVIGDVGDVGDADTIRRPESLLLVVASRSSCCGEDCRAEEARGLDLANSLIVISLSRVDVFIFLVEGGRSNAIYELL